ncbi:MAG: transcriptional regulator [Gemmobacter sp.]|nr:transcriptional regulator [Gemmobacter sp.]
MARPRSVPDQLIFEAVHALTRLGGAKAVTFGAVAEKVGLAASTLVQRYGSVDGMTRGAQAAAWTRMEHATAAAVADAPMTPKGAAALLKALATVPMPAIPGSADDALVARALAWRTQVEASLAVRLGGGVEGREGAAILFAAWQGQMLWLGRGAKGFRLRDAARRLGG